MTTERRDGPMCWSILVVSLFCLALFAYTVAARDWWWAALFGAMAICNAIAARVAWSIEDRD